MSYLGVLNQSPLSEYQHRILQEYLNNPRIHNNLLAANRAIGKHVYESIEMRNEREEGGRKSQMEHEKFKRLIKSLYISGEYHGRNFMPFSRLPIELRLKIWRLALPKRRLLSFHPYLESLVGSTIALLSVNYEAREQALRRYKLLCYTDLRDITSAGTIFLDPHTDIVQLQYFAAQLTLEIDQLGIRTGGKGFGAIQQMVIDAALVAWSHDPVTCSDRTSLEGLQNLTALKKIVFVFDGVVTDDGRKELASYLRSEFEFFRTVRRGFFANRELVSIEIPSKLLTERCLDNLNLANRTIFGRFLPVQYRKVVRAMVICDRFFLKLFELAEKYPDWSLPDVQIKGLQVYG